MIFAKEPSSSDFVFTLVIILVIIGLGVFLFLSVRKQHKKNKAKAEETNSTMGMVSLKSLEESLDEFIRVYHLSKEASIFIFSLENANELATSFGQKTEEKIRQSVLQNVIQVLPKAAIFSEYHANNDTYVILLRGNLPQNRLQSFANYIVDTIERPVPVPGMDVQTSYSCYLGMAFYPAHAITTKELLNKADLALYMNSKNPGKKFMIYSNSFDNAEVANLTYYNEIKSAIKNEEFTLYYQPIINYSEKKVIGYETLMRWNHPTLGVLPPNKFLSILENSGDIIWVSKWGIHSICNFYNKNIAAFREKGIVFTINLTVKQLLNASIVNDYVSILNQYHVPASAICLEIEEYALYEKYQTINITINEFIKKGFKVAIDHFGLDSNNIRKLDERQLYMIKMIAKDIIEAKDSFINARIFDILVEACKKMNTNICALMVENQEDVDKIVAAGVNFEQGYFVSKPLSEEETVEYINNTEFK